MHNYKILIVEDEILIADNIARYLVRKGYNVLGIAINYEEAITKFEQSKPDIILLDIRLHGNKTGIDVGHYINSHKQKRPFIFLTSQMDSANIENAKLTLPAGYLSKPIHKDNLVAAIEIAMHTFQHQAKSENKIALFDGEQHFLVLIESILYLKADHVYVQVSSKDHKPILQRSSLKDLLDQLPKEQFLQTHRSYAINLKEATSWSNDYVNISDEIIPISRSKKKNILELLQKAHL